MQRKSIDEISEGALFLFPFLRRLFNGDSRDPALVSLRNQTYHLLRILDMRGPLPLSGIGNLLFIAKQNMTTLVDVLQNDGLVKRKNDSADRRVKNVAITKKGKKVLQERREGLKRIVAENLSRLDDKNIQSLHSALIIAETIVKKLG